MKKKNIKEKTRGHILMLLKRDGPQEAADLAKQFDITDMAVRQHLYALEEQGDIYYSTVPRPKGRPAKLWQLTEKSNSHFPNHHAEFSSDLISSVQQVFGATGMDKLLDVRFEEQIKEYAPLFPSSQPLKNKLERLVAIRSEEGYMADIIQDHDQEKFLLVENHCPICEAARSCSGICARELDLFKELLGNDVNVKRTEHIIHGARRCAYEISKD